MNKLINKGRRPRRQNGNARDKTPWTIKGLGNTTRFRIQSLAQLCGTTQASIIEAGIDLLHEQLVGTVSEKRKGNTFSRKSSNDLINDLLDRTPSNHPSVLKLERELLERRNRRKAFLAEHLRSEICPHDPSEDKSSV